MMMEIETKVKKPTKWRVGLICLIAIILAGLYPIRYSAAYYVVGVTELGSWEFIDICNYMPQELTTLINKSEDKEAAINNWCDSLIKHSEDYKYRLDWRENKTNNYVVNSEAAKLLAAGQTIPPDMIFMFDGTIGWNQVGMKEKVRDEYLWNIFTAVTGDFSIVKAPVAQIDRLRWTAEYKAKPFYNASSVYVNYIALIAAAAATISAAAAKPRNFIAILAAVFIAALSAGVTIIMAEWGNNMLYIPKIDTLPYGALCVIGASAGVIFAAIMSSIKETDKTRLFCKLIITGALLGAITSCFSHAAIMAFRETTEAHGIIGGSGYGLYTGLLLAIFLFTVKCEFIPDNPDTTQEQL